MKKQKSLPPPKKASNLDVIDQKPLPLTNPSQYVENIKHNIDNHQRKTFHFLQPTKTTNKNLIENQSKIFISPLPVTKFPIKKNEPSSSQTSATYDDNQQQVIVSLKPKGVKGRPKKSTSQTVKTQNIQEYQSAQSSSSLSNLANQSQEHHDSTISSTESSTSTTSLSLDKKKRGRKPKIKISDNDIETRSVSLNSQELQSTQSSTESSTSTISLSLDKKKRSRKPEIINSDHHMQTRSCSLNTKEEYSTEESSINSTQMNSRKRNFSESPKKLTNRGRKKKQVTQSFNRTSQETTTSMQIDNNNDDDDDYMDTFSNESQHLNEAFVDFTENNDDLSKFLESCIDSKLNESNLSESDLNLTFNLMHSIDLDESLLNQSIDVDVQKIEQIQTLFNLNFNNAVVKQLVKKQFQKLNIEPIPFFQASTSHNENNVVQVLNCLLQKNCFSQNQLDTLAREWLTNKTLTSTQIYDSLHGFKLFFLLKILDRINLQYMDVTQVIKNDLFFKEKIACLITLTNMNAHETTFAVRRFFNGGNLWKFQPSNSDQAHVDNDCFKNVFDKANTTNTSISIQIHEILIHEEHMLYSYTNLDLDYAEDNVNKTFTKLLQSIVRQEEEDTNNTSNNNQLQNVYTDEFNGNIENYLNAFNLKLIDIPNDGHCFLSAIRLFFAQFKNTIISFDTISNMILTYLTNNQADLSGFIDDGSRDFNSQIGQYLFEYRHDLDIVDIIVSRAHEIFNVNIRNITEHLENNNKLTIHNHNISSRSREASHVVMIYKDSPYLNAHYYLVVPEKTKMRYEFFENNSQSIQKKQDFLLNVDEYANNEESFSYYTQDDDNVDLVSETSSLSSSNVSLASKSSAKKKRSKSKLTYGKHNKKSKAKNIASLNKRALAADQQKQQENIQNQHTLYHSYFNEEPVPFHEKQYMRYCGKHALNNALQIKDAFTQQQFKDYAAELQVILRRTNPNNNTLLYTNIGDYHIDLLFHALEKKELKVHSVTRYLNNGLKTSNDAAIYIVAIKPPGMLHYYALRRFFKGGHLWNLDSMNPNPRHDDKHFDTLNANEYQII